MLEVWKKRARDTRAFANSAATSGNIMLVCSLLSMWSGNLKWAAFCLITGGLNWFLSGRFAAMADKADAKVKEIEARQDVL